VLNFDLQADFDMTTADFYGLTRGHPPLVSQSGLIELSRFRHGNTTKYRVLVPGHGDEELKAGVGFDGMTEHIVPDAQLWLPPAVVQFLLRAADKTSRPVLLSEENKNWSKKLKEAKKVGWHCHLHCTVVRSRH
jgi:hypothetical protein